MGPPIYMCYAPENEKEDFDLGVLGFAHINIFITIYGEEELNLRVLGRGRRRANSDFISFYIILLKKIKGKSLSYAILGDLFNILNHFI